MGGFGTVEGDIEEESETNNHWEETEQPEEETTEHNQTQKVENKKSNQTEQVEKKENNNEKESTEKPTEQIPDLTEINLTEDYSPSLIAQALTANDYENEAGIPYVMWRNGSSTGRKRITIELNQDVDELIEQGRRKFDDQYDGKINKGDIREMAMVCGLMHLDEVFEMAEEWGLQYDN